MTAEHHQISKLVQLKIDTAQIRECCRKHDEVFISSILAVIFACFLGLDRVAAHTVYLWAAGTLLILLIRFLFVFFLAKQPDHNIQKHHLYQYVAILVLWGAAWALGTVLFFPHLPVLMQAAWFAIFMGMVAASAASHAVYMPAFLAYSVTFFIGIAWGVMTEFPAPYHANVLAVALILITQIGAARKGNRVMMESLSLRFQNIELIDQLKEEKEGAERANLAKSKFLAAASHDLRQPLHALTLFGSALQDSLDDKQKARAIVGQINASVDALQELFNALLDMSRLDAGTLVCVKEHFSSQTLFDKLINDFQPVATAKGLTLEWEKKHYSFYSDPTLLQLILRNLLANALRYTHEGGVSVLVSEQNGGYNIEVTDTGIGIPEEQQCKIYDEFVQLHNPERDRTKGLGLGLSIVKRVSQLLGNKIALTSHVGQGSQFSVTVDKGQTNMIEHHSQAIEGSADSSANIVVIDDEQPILDAMQLLLNGWGYRVFVATEVNQAMAVLQKHNAIPHCIIADYRLRENNTGLQAIQVIRDAYGNDTPALIVSGDIAPERLMQVKTAGLPMLHKPVQPAMLRSFLRNKL